MLLGYTNALVVVRVIRVSDNGFSSPYSGVSASKPIYWGEREQAHILG